MRYYYMYGPITDIPKEMTSEQKDKHIIFLVNEIEKLIKRNIELETVKV